MLLNIWSPTSIMVWFQQASSDGLMCRTSTKGNHIRCFDFQKGASAFSGPKSGRNGYITLAFSGSPIKGTKMFCVGPSEKGPYGRPLKKNLGP